MAAMFGKKSKFPACVSPAGAVSECSIFQLRSRVRYGHCERTHRPQQPQAARTSGHVELLNQNCCFENKASMGQRLM